jgi:hypothetical protein
MPVRIKLEVTDPRVFLSDGFYKGHNGCFNDLAMPDAAYSSDAGTAGASIFMDMLQSLRQRKEIALTRALMFVM